MTADTVATPAIAAFERWKLRIGTIAWFLLGLGLLLGLPVVLDVAWWAFAILAVLALVLAFPIWWIIRRIFPGQRRRGRAGGYFKTAFALLAILAVVVAAPIYALASITAIRPLTVPQATLTNGDKTLIFQGMTHIGSEGFYKSVVYDIEKALSEGYVIFYEGVTSDPAGEQWFSDTMAGGGDLSTNYAQFGDACGLKFQLDYFGLLGADMAEHPDRHVAADVSTADMMREYQRLEAEDSDFAARVAAEKAPAPKEGDTVGGGVASLFALIERATPGQRALLGVACRGWINWVLSQKSEPSALDPVVLDYRNQELAKLIEAGPDKIFTTYGAGHLPGLLADLQANDPNWTIGSVKWIRTIDTPEDLDGEIE